MKPVFPNTDVVWVGTKKPVCAQADDFGGARLRAGLSCQCSRAREGCDSTGRSCYEFTPCRHNQDSIPYRLKLNSRESQCQTDRDCFCKKYGVKKRLQHGSTPSCGEQSRAPWRPSGSAGYDLEDLPRSIGDRHAPRSGPSQPVQTKIPYFAPRKVCNRRGRAALNSCQVSTLHRVRNSASRTQLILGYQASIRSCRPASTMTQKLKSDADAARTFRSN